MGVKSPANSGANLLFLKFVCFRELSKSLVFRRFCSRAIPWSGRNSARIRANTACCHPSSTPMGAVLSHRSQAAPCGRIHTAAIFVCPPLLLSPSQPTLNARRCERLWDGSEMKCRAFSIHQSFRPAGANLSVLASPRRIHEGLVDPLGEVIIGTGEDGSAKWFLPIWNGLEVGHISP